MNVKPKALRLADALDAGFECDLEWYERESAMELRRLYSENQTLLVAMMDALRVMETCAPSIDTSLDDYHENAWEELFAARRKLRELLVDRVTDKTKKELQDAGR